MKIMHVISSLGSGGAENLVCNLSIEFCKTGHEVAIIYISSAESLGVSVEYENKIKNLLINAGVKIYELGHICRINPILGALRLRNYIDQFSPNVIHLHLYYGIVFYALSFKKIYCLYTHHNISFGLGRYLYKVFDLFVYKYIGICIATTKMLENLTKQPVILIYNAIPIDNIIHRTERTDNCNRLISVGRLNKQKNYPLLISAIADINSRRPELQTHFNLRILGEGNQRALIENAIMSNKIHNVQLMGVRNDVPAQLANSDIFIMSSDFEGLPIALLEAIGAGLAVVVTDVGGNREIVEKINAGILVPANDVVALSAAIEKLIIDNNLRKYYSDNSVVGIADFSITNAAMKHLVAYKL